MSTGSKFLRAVVESENKKLLRRARPEFFTDEETPAFNFICDYLTKYKALPDITTLEENGFKLAKLRGKKAPEYTLDELRRRFAYTAVNELHPSLTSAMRQMNMDEVMKILRSMLHEAAGAIDAQKYSTLANEAQAILKDYKIAKASSGIRGITTGWDKLDMMTGGMMGGDMTVIVGRPAIGKSWCLDHMSFAAQRAKKVTGVLSMEMSLAQMARRRLAQMTGANPKLIRDGELSYYAEKRLLGAATKLHKLPPVHLLAGNMKKSVDAISQMTEEFDLDALYIDAAYLLTPSGRRNGFISKWESIGTVVGELKALAIERDIPIAITVQFNREVKGNSDKDPDLSQIGGSDSIPQDASNVVGILQGEAPYQKSRRRGILMKQRDGETGRFGFRFNFSPMDFSEVPLLEDEEVDDDVQVTSGSWMV